ncbi:MAG: hypothetical protein M1825_004434 [Sarcosagium campestre]|nr:MAG: hypothetical protein M1825_004434 [Sarcosagium campestre]
MAGKKLVDVAALFNASRSVAKKHVALRSRQLDEFSKTSTLVKSVVDQTREASRVGQSFVQSAGRPTAVHDNTYRASEQPELDGRRSDSNGPPLSNETIKKDSKKLSPDKARQIQRQAEHQIPSHTARSEKKISPEGDDIARGNDRDVFYTPTQSTSPSLSNLPRTKIPKRVDDTQSGDDHVKDGQINADVYYSSKGARVSGPVPSVEAVPVQEHTPEEINTDVFHSPRVSKLLGGKDKSSEKDLQLDATSRTPIDHTKLAAGRDQDVFNVRDSKQDDGNHPSSSAKRETPGVEKNTGTDDIRQLASDLSQDVDNKIVEETPHSENKTPYRMHESRVPSSQFGRLWQYGGLATSMAFGAVGESLRRVTGSSTDADGSLMLSAANMNRLVTKLSRMRGAALKLGQMMSFQDSKMLPGPINEVLQRVQDSADYMPTYQRDKVLTGNLGPEWRSLFSSFDDIPLAAASIGQVHGAILKSSGQRVAVKVQYPGVADSIDSDLDNLSLLLTASRLLPKGLYLDKTIANARTELAWECDYEREAGWGRKFKDLLRDEQGVFTVPDIIAEASAKQVLTMQRMEGVGVTKARDLSQEQRDWIGSNILRLCLRELTEFGFMQTDPNWTNFLWNAQTRKLELLDFGASREYPANFLKPYVSLLAAASHKDRDAVLEYSIELGYLTGHESTRMRDAHLESILTLAEPFAADAPAIYDFSNQTVTERVRGLIPIMIRERLRPPPEETYSLHRKLSGAFLLCARLGSRVQCRDMFAAAIAKMGGGVYSNSAESS